MCVYDGTLKMKACGIKSAHFGAKCLKSKALRELQKVYGNECYEDYDWI